MLRLTANTILARAPDAEQREIRDRTALLRKTAARKTVDALERKNAVADIVALPGNEESLHIICRGNFPLWTIVPALLTLAEPATIASLSIATLGFSKQNVADLLALLDAGQVASVSIVASVYFERQNPAEYQMMQTGLAARGQRIAALRAHAKVIAMELTDGRGFTVESSANLRSCRNLEQITLIQSRPLTAFHAGWIRRAIEAGTSTKTKRRRRPGSRDGKAGKT